MARTIAAIVAAAFLLTATPSLARDEAALKAAAQAFVDHPFMQQLLDALTSRDTIQRISTGAAQAAGKNLRDDRIETISWIVSEELQRLRPRLKELLAEAASETLSLEEIRALTPPFDTNPAADVKANLAKMMKAFRASVTPLKEQFSRRVKARMQAELPQ